MYMTEKIKEMLPLAVSIMLALPDDCLASISDKGKGELSIHLQAGSLDEVRRLRSLFPGSIWAKSRHETLNWWEYSATVNGIHVEIYGCTEAPPTCRMVTREIEIEEQVPVEWEMRRVPKTVVEWECGEGAEA